MRAVVQKINIFQSVLNMEPLKLMKKYNQKSVNK